MKISIFGMGYVGVVSGACLAKLGHEIVGVDTNAGKVALVNGGKAPIVETGIEALINEMIAAKRLSATSDAADAVMRTDVTFISVGTPSGRNGLPALDALDAVVGQIGSALRRKPTPHTVVVRSTVPPGTIEERVVPGLIRSSGRQPGNGLEVCSNPEFLREGSAIRDFGQPAFTLIGCMGPAGVATMTEVYRGVNAPVIATEVRTAEAIKYLCNVFHAVKIGFANEVGALLKSLGLDSREAMRIFCEDRALNISPAYLRPGFAFGGSCLPKDLRAVISLARDHGVELPFIGNLPASNERHIDRAFELIAEGGRRRIALFGLAFKPGTDDLRESPLVALAERLIGKGFDLSIYDRHVEVARLVGSNREFIDREIPHIERLLAASPEAALEGAGRIVIGHAGADEIAVIAARHGGRPIIDLQGAKDLQDLAGAEYQGICW
jgi:GDP-mannose 6-dehydrogenase